MMRIHCRHDDGAVAIIVAITLVVLFTFAALTVDIGYWYSVERQLQTAADASALAGCQVLIRGGSEDDVWAEVDAYIARNEDGLLEVAVLDDTRSYVDMTDGVVKVTLTTEKRSVLARAFGTDSALIPAQAVAKAGYLAGARSPIPWGMPINRARDVTVQVGAGPEVPLSLVDENGNGVNDDMLWRGSIPTGSAGAVTVRAYNGQTAVGYPNGIPTELVNVAEVVSLPADSPFTSVSVTQGQVFTAPDSPGGALMTFKAETVAPLAAGQSIELSLAGGAKFSDGNTKLTLTPVGPTTFTASARAPYTDDLASSYAAEIGIKNVSSPVPVRFSVRRSTFPIEQVTLTRSVFPSGSTPAATVNVRLHDYTKGTLYTLKVVGGAGEVGNFMALDYTLAHHYEPGTYKPQNQDVEFPWLASNDSYLPLIEGTFDDPRLILHLEDIVWTQPGTGPAPQVERALDTRIAGEASDYAGWIAQDPRPMSRRVVYLPIVELLEDEGGRTAVRIVSFASFYITDYDNSTIWGRFVEYAAPAWVVVDDPPGGLTTKVAHLVSEDLDF